MGDFKKGQEDLSFYASRFQNALPMFEGDISLRSTYLNPESDLNVYHYNVRVHSYCPFDPERRDELQGVDTSFLDFFLTFSGATQKDVVVKTILEEKKPEEESIKSSLQLSVPSVNALELSIKIDAEKLKLKEENVKPAIALTIPPVVVHEFPTKKIESLLPSYVSKQIADNLYVTLEQLTPLSKDFWRKRIYAESFLLCGGQLTGMEIAEQIEQFKAIDNADTSIVGIFGEPISYKKSLGETFCDWSNDFTPQEKEELAPLFKKFLSKNKLSEDMYAYSSDFEKLRLSYLGAWNGFLYNLSKAPENTWIAYVSDLPPSGPLHENVNPFSSSIKMALSLVVDPSLFYSPLGIYKSPIGAVLEEKPSNNLSLSFHREVAGLVKDLYSDVAYMVVRPLGKMEDILKSSGVPFSSTLGESVKDLPYIADLFKNGHNNDKSRFMLVDPKENKSFPISNNHWFSLNPYMGGAANSGLFYMTTNIKDLMQPHKNNAQAE